MIENLIEVQTVQIGSEFYRLVEVPGESPLLAWEESFEDEAAYEGGTPDILSQDSSSWDGGAFKSWEALPNTCEFGQNTDGRWSGKLLPSPALTTISLTGSTTPPTVMFEAFGRLFIACGTKLFRVNPADDSVVLSYTGGAIKDGLSWEGIGLITLANQVLKCTALGAGPDTWSANTAAGVKLAKGFDRLFKVNQYGVLKNLVAGSGGDPITEADYADEVQCGDYDLNHPPNSLVAYERTVLVGKPEGLFGVGEEGKGIPLITRMPFDNSNCVGMAVQEPYVLVPTPRILYRFSPGSVESAGLEQELFNEMYRLPFNSFTFDGQWVFAIGNFLGSAFFVFVGREARGEQSLGPIIWDTLMMASANTSYVCHVSHLWDPPRLFFGYTNNLAWIPLPSKPGPPIYQDTSYFGGSGIRASPRYTYGTWRPKNFLKVEAAGLGCSATKYWQLSYSVDEAGFLTTDINGNLMKVNSGGLFTFTLPRAAAGQWIQYKWTYVGVAGEAAAALTYFKHFAIPYTPKVRQYKVTLLLGGELRHDGGVEQRTSITQLNDLLALTEAKDSVAFSGPWGDLYGIPRRIRTLESRQEGHENPRFLVELQVQKR